MQRSALAILTMLCALAYAGYSQTAAPAPAPLPRLHGPERQAAIAAGGGKDGETSVNTSSVGMDQPVITLKGTCTAAADAAPPKDCVSTVTRAQFEKLTEALQPSMTADSRRAFATNYGRLLVFVDAARALHLENDPGVQLVLQFVTDQVLAESVKRHYAEQYSHPSDQQVQDYYNQNSAKYVEATLERIIIPRSPGSAEKPKPAEAEEKAAADKVRERWVGGEDPVKLQQAAYQAVGVTSPGTPEISMGAKRAGSLPPSQEAVFQLKAGEVSPVYSDSAAFYVYKVVSIKPVPIGDVKDSIVKTLQQQQLQQKLEEIGKSATPVLNEAYFGPGAVAGAPAMAARPGASVSPNAGTSPK